MFEASDRARARACAQINPPHVLLPRKQTEGDLEAIMEGGNSEGKAYEDKKQL